MHVDWHCGFHDVYTPWHCGFHARRLGDVYVAPRSVWALSITSLAVWFSCTLLHGWLGCCQSLLWHCGFHARLRCSPFSAQLHMRCQAERVDKPGKPDKESDVVALTSESSGACLGMIFLPREIGLEWVCEAYYSCKLMCANGLRMGLRCLLFGLFAKLA